MENTSRKEVFQGLRDYYEANKGDKLRLQNLLKDQERTKTFKIQQENYMLDYSKQHLDSEGMEHLLKIGEKLKLQDQIHSMFTGGEINVTEKRSVLHTALRMPKSASLVVDGVDVVKDVHAELESIREFATKVRHGEITGCTGKRISTILSIGIGGSYLGVRTAFEAFRSTREGFFSSRDYDAVFLADPDPLDFKRIITEADPESTLVIILSKSFTTAETMLNARTARNWILKDFAAIDATLTEQEIIKSHFCAVSTNLEGTSKFGIDDDRVFKFWDWVGGRFSVSSAIGVLSLSIIFGWDLVHHFLQGMNNIDENFKNEKDLRKNISVVTGLLGFFNSTVEGYDSRCILPYNQGLNTFFNHVQQVSMESNGKGVDVLGGDLDGYQAGYVVFGEAGTKGQHSFFQLLHQGNTNFLIFFQFFSYFPVFLLFPNFPQFFFF